MEYASFHSSLLLFFGKDTRHDFSHFPPLSKTIWFDFMALELELLRVNVRFGFEEVIND